MLEDRLDKMEKILDTCHNVTLNSCCTLFWDTSFRRNCDWISLSMISLVTHEG